MRKIVNDWNYRGPYVIYHIPSENVPLKSEIFTKNVKEWPIEILNVNRKCPIIKIFDPNKAENKLTK